MACISFRVIMPTSSKNSLFEGLIRSSNSCSSVQFSSGYYSNMLCTHIYSDATSGSDNARLNRLLTKAMCYPSHKPFRGGC